MAFHLEKGYLAMKFMHAVLLSAFSLALSNASFAEEATPAQPTPAQTPAPAADVPVLGTLKSPIEVVKEAPVGSLKNPYKNANDAIIERGRKRFLGASCNGCHGGTGGGGMCPPLTNDVWVYGSDDDTLYRLITLGSVDLVAQTGLSRKGRENVVGPMPPHGSIIKTDDDLWKIITFIRANFRGDPKNITWQ